MKSNDIVFDTEKVIKILDSCVLLEKYEEPQEYWEKLVLYESISYIDPVNAICYDVVKDLNVLSVEFSNEQIIVVDFEDAQFLLKTLIGCITRSKNYQNQLSENNAYIGEVLELEAEKKYKI